MAPSCQGLCQGPGKNAMGAMSGRDAKMRMEYRLGKTWCRDDTWKEGTGRGGIKETSLVRKGKELVKGWWILGFKGQTARKVEGGQRRRWAGAVGGQS